MTNIDNQILSLLREGKTLSRPEAQRLGFGMCLPDRIYRLRSAGYHIKSWPDKNGYHRYALNFNMQHHEDLFRPSQLWFEFSGC